MGATKKRGWTVEDRGMDSSRHIRDINAEGYKGVVRIKDMNRDVFCDGKAIDKSLEKKPFRAAHLRTFKGDREVQIRWKRGSVQHCDDPENRDAAVAEVDVLVETGIRA